MTAAAAHLLSSADDGIAAAAASAVPAERFLHAHLAASRAAAAVIAVRGTRPRVRRETLWGMLARAEPALREDAQLFAAAESQRSAADARLPKAVSAQDADGMLAAARAFVAAARLATGLRGEP